jgi:hypothetical protein
MMVHDRWLLLRSVRRPSAVGGSIVTGDIPLPARISEAATVDVTRPTSPRWLIFVTNEKK